MGQRAPTLGQIAVAVAFAFSCFGLLLFLWVTFGGPVPLKPEGYRVKVPFSEASQLAQEQGKGQYLKANEDLRRLQVKLSRL